MKIFDGAIDAAYEMAVETAQPLFVPATYYTDDRGWSLMNQLQGVLSPAGQVNYSVMYPDVIKAWHRHRRQTDFWICLMGHLKVGVYAESGQSWRIIMGEKRPGVLVIPPPLWHGACTVGPESAGLLYYVTAAYDPQHPDEERRAHDSVEGFSWGVEFK